MPACIICETTFPNTMEIDGANRNLQRRKYCLDCSPFGQHNTKQLHKESLGSKKCKVICQECAKEYIATTRFGKFCSKICQITFNWKINIIPEILNGECDNSKRLKQYISEISGYRCSRCNIDEWDGEKLVLELEHIDGNSDNNYLSNLKLLCPNCHSLTPTFKGRNIGNPNTKRKGMHRDIYKRAKKLYIDDFNPKNI